VPYFGTIVQFKFLMKLKLSLYMPWMKILEWMY